MEAGRGHQRNARTVRWIAGIAVAAAALVLPSLATAHVERPSYWPEPGADGPYGGDVPDARSLASALDSPEGEEVRVVCQDDSLALAKASIKKANDKGYRLRPSEKKRKLSNADAKELKDINIELAELCAYDSIQDAVDDSGNDDRIIVMPGHYIEEDSRAAPTDDPACDAFEEDFDPGPADTNTPTYEYHVNCPNDQSLVFVQGRALNGDPPNPALEDRHGLPDEGECIRCGLQIEGSGVTPNDVLLDAATDPENTGLREFPGEDAAKDVGIRVDRADDFVLRNMTFAHAFEHGVYVMETDGFLLERTKYFYSGEYGNLLFQSDHGLVDTCEGMGHGDSAVYPGSAADTGEDAADDSPVFYPDAPRTSITIRKCDIHHNTLGYSGTMGNATRVTKNEFWDNGTAITTDSLYAGGHPGFPQDSARFDHNNIYSNNFNSFVESSDVVPKVPVPVGVGIFIAGGNNNQIDNNRIWNNWKRGTMLLTLPDPLFGRDTELNTTSHRNEYHDNLMGRRLDGKKAPNGVDFWWDAANPFNDGENDVMTSGVEDNCWHDNGKFTSEPPPPDVPGTNEGGRLPAVCEHDTNADDSYDVYYFGVLASELLPCEGAIGAGEFDPEECHWFVTPPKPGSAKAKLGTAVRELSVTGVDCALAGDTQSCAAFAGRP